MTPQPPDGPRLRPALNYEVHGTKFIREVMRYGSTASPALTQARALQVISLAEEFRRYIGDFDASINPKLEASVSHAKSQLLRDLHAALQADKFGGNDLGAEELLQLRAALVYLGCDGKDLISIDMTLLTQWQGMTKGNVARVADKDAKIAAALCLQHAQGQSAHVEKVLAMNANVRDQAVLLLQEDAQHAPEEQHALALCLLQAGHRISGSDLAPKVARLVEQREQMNEQYWEEKAAKHASLMEPDHFGRPREFQAKGKPFFHASHKYARENLNGRLKTPQSPDKPLWCRHLTEAVDGSRQFTKRALQDISIHDVNTLDYGLLEETHLARQGMPTLNCSPRNFGRLIARLALDMDPGESRSFSVGWPWSKRHGEGHEMRLFLSKTNDGRISAGLYEPNVSGDISHEKVFPEFLANQSFDDFDKLGIRRASGNEVLSIQVDDVKFAKACVGLFVDPDSASQAASLAVALKDGNISEAQSALRTLGTMSNVLGGDELQSVSDALIVAARSGHSSFLTPMTALERIGLKPEQFEAVKLFLALKSGDAVAVRNSMDALDRAASRRNIQISETLRGDDIVQGMQAALRLGHAAALQEFMGALPKLGLTTSETAEIVAARNVDDIAALHVVGAEGDVAAVDAFLVGLQKLGLAPLQIAEVLIANKFDYSTTAFLYTRMAAIGMAAPEGFLG